MRRKIVEWFLSVEMSWTENLGNIAKVGREVGLLCPSREQSVCKMTCIRIQ